MNHSSSAPLLALDLSPTSSERPAVVAAVASFERVYDENFAFVWRTLRRLGVRPSDLGDVTQDVFVVVHRRLHEFEGRSKMTTWLFAICFRATSTYRRKVQPTYDADYECVADPNCNVDENVAHREAVRLVEHALERLPVEQRAVFVMFELEGLSGEDIAEALSIPEGTVRSRLRLGRGTFREEIKRLRTASARMRREAVPGE